MMDKGYFKGKKITVIGLARSGYTASLLLKDLGAEVYITDADDNDLTRKNSIILEAKGISRIELGKHTESFIKGKDLVVASPGVCDGSIVLAWARQFGIPVISEIELSFLACPAKIIATTGTNGKTTVTTLIGKVINASGKNAVVCGNIGNPFSGEVNRLSQEDFVSLEVSSFQLEKISKFKPYICVILNFAPDHLDRYKDTRQYLDAKKRIYMNQDKTDFVVLNYDDSSLRPLEKEIKANVRYFRQAPGLNQNQSAVMEVAKILEIDRQVCLEVFSAFKGIEHRLELVSAVNGVEFINDSKATNVDSTIWALSNLNKPIVLIAGGRDKGIDYSLLSDLVKKKVRALVLIGEAKEKIKSALGGLVNNIEASSMQEAVEQAYRLSRPGDCVLLSPMCASFDMFKNYEDRGRVFKSTVLNLNKRIE